MNSKVLMAELESLNKMIFEAAIMENANRYITNNNINLIGDNKITENIENEKIIQKITSVNAMIDYHQNGGLITKCKMKVTKRMKRLYNMN